MDEAFNKQVRPLLDLIDNLREIGLQDEISLPQICVMGDQSSGKSSVLQSISNIPFPRGSGLVTRCPTELIMSKSKPGTSWVADISVSWQKPQPECAGVVHSVDELAPIMSRLADILTENKINSFTTDRIVIKVSSPDSPDLTLIDLPGIVRTATTGQDVDVIQQVNSLIDSYISMSNTIILAMIPSNQDIATIDILERASTADPNGERTIGVLTKPDLIGPGNEEEVVQVLLNKTKPLKLGYVMVKNISQKQLNEGITLPLARKDENSFFANHPVFAKVAVDHPVFGFEHLISELTVLLVSCIKRSIPDMLQDVRRLLNDCQDELQKLGSDLPVDARDQQALLMKKISKYCCLVTSSTRGDYRDEDGLLAKHEHYRLHAKFQHAFKLLQENIFELRPSTTTTTTYNNDNDNDNDNEADDTNTRSSASLDLTALIEQDLVNQKGRELPGFLNSQVFYAQIINLVEQWRPIVEDCKAQTLQSVLSVCSQLSYELIKEFPELCNAVQAIANELIDATAAEVGEKLETLLAGEQNPFTSQDVLLEVVNGIRFRTFENVLRQILDTTDVSCTGADAYAIRDDIRIRLGNWYMTRHGVDATGNEQELVTLIQAYWDIASRRLVDNVCMLIDMEFANKFVRELETRCVLFGISQPQDRTRDLLQEDLLIGQRRKRLTDRAQKLSQSLAVLDHAVGVSFS